MNVVKAYLAVHSYAQILLETISALAGRALFYRVTNMDVKVSMKNSFALAST